MLERELREYLKTVTPEIIKEKQEKYDAYLNRQYKGKPWRRLSNEEIILLKDAELLARLNELNGIVPPEDKATFTNENGEQETVIYKEDPREIKSNEQYIVGPGGDLPFDSPEDWDKFDQTISSERKRIYRLITSPPRTDRYVDVFKRKFPNKKEEDIRAGFVLSKDGVNTPDYDEWIERQNKSHKRSGKSRLSKEERDRREAIEPENVEALAYADTTATLKIHREILGNSGVGEHVARRMFRDSKKVEITENDHYNPDDDIVKPVVVSIEDGENNELDTISTETLGKFDEALQDQVAIANERIQKQKDSLKITELVRHIPTAGEQ